MKRYKTSLKDWREHQTKSLKENLLLYLNVFSDVLNVSRFLSENFVNHYDIKTDNYLIEPYDRDLSKDELYAQPTDVPNFTVCLADFGESLLYESEEGGYTSDNRGSFLSLSPFRFPAPLLITHSVPALLSIVFCLHFHFLRLFSLPSSFLTSLSF